MSAPRLLLAGGAIVVLIGALWLWPGRARHRPEATAAAPAEAPEPPPLAQREDPPAPAATAPPQAEPPAAPAAPVQPPAPARVIPMVDDRPAPSPQLASAWAIDYRDAVCACHTRSCVRDLQGAFVRRLGAMAPGDENDVQRYSEATHAALKCYFALPEGS